LSVPSLTTAPRHPTHARMPHFNSPQSAPNQHGKERAAPELGRSAHI
jgi:hypothetical protein